MVMPVMPVMHGDYNDVQQYLSMKGLSCFQETMRNEEAS
jgi:hypothetical protein